MNNLIEKQYVYGTDKYHHFFDKNCEQIIYIMNESIVVQKIENKEINFDG